MTSDEDANDKKKKKIKKIQYVPQSNALFSHSLDPFVCLISFLCWAIICFVFSSFINISFSLPISENPKMIKKKKVEEKKNMAREYYLFISRFLLLFRLFNFSHYFVFIFFFCFCLEVTFNTNILAYLSQNELFVIFSFLFSEFLFIK